MTRHRCILALILVLGSFLNAAPALSAAPGDYIVRPGDTLAMISSQLLGSSGRYLEIVHLTNAMHRVDERYAFIENPGHIVVGWRLAIPDKGTTALAATPLYTAPTTRSFIVDTIPTGATPKGILKSIAKGVTPDGAHTVTLTFYDYPPALLAQLATPMLSMSSPAAIRRWGRDYTFHPVGTGPYRFQEWIPNERIVLAANPSYWGERAKIKHLIYQVIPTSATRLAALQAGAVDVAYDLSPADLAVAEVDPDLIIHRTPPLSTGYLAINRDWANADGEQPLKDVRVRQAIAHAIDKEGLVQAFLPHTGIPAKSFVPPILWSDDDGLPTYEYNPERARVLLAKAGYPVGFETTLWVMTTPRSYFPDPLGVGEAIQEDLRAVGIEAKIVRYDWDIYLDRVLNRGEHALCLLGWMPDVPDPDNYFRTLFTGADKQFGAGPPSAELESLIRAGREIDPEAREALYRQAHAIVHGVVPGVPVAHNGAAFAGRQGLIGFMPSLLDVWSAVDHDQDTLVIARSRDSVGLDVVGEVDGESFAVGAQLYEGLVALEPGTMRITPALAESWTVSEDGLIWTFTLRQGITFHDGTLVNADAVLYNLERMWDPNHPSRAGSRQSFAYWTYFFEGFRGEVVGE
jgi:ABC-type transport system substrate-binding protein